MSEFIQFEQQGGVAILTLDAPDTRNALSGPEQFEALERACRRIQVDRSIRVAILTGAGKAFCAGGDVKLMLQRVRERTEQAIEERYRYQEGIHRMVLALHNLEVPTIAAVNGAAIGAGLDLACLCDLRVCSERAVFAESFVKVGIIPGDGGAWLLQRIIGQARAAEMTFTGDTIDAQTALAYGLVSKVVPGEQLRDEALALAARVAANPPHALRMAKRLMRESAHSRLESILEMSAAYQALAHATDDHRACVEHIVKRIG
ncbi:crotonase/enoyl-CoA hydratase family protein [Pseudomonas sp. A014]|uniref:crotonase/enoyl-CoA hydratase family protein n=1 Tax=Pseudomonas sp. A014 TaxID=3458058 RepID=UPI004036B7A3